MIRKLNPEKKNAYLQAALKLFVAQGVSNTSTAAIAKEAGTASGTLFLYFPTKQALIDALVMQVVQQEAEAIYVQFDAEQSAYEMFAVIWHETIGWFLHNLDAYTFIQQVRDTGLVGEEAVKASDNFFQFYYQAIRKGLEEGTIGAYPVELIGNVLYHDIVAVLDVVKAIEDVDGQEKYIQAGFDIFWNGICVDA